MYKCMLMYMVDFVLSCCCSAAGDMAPVDWTPFSAMAKAQNSPIQKDMIMLAYKRGDAPHPPTPSSRHGSSSGPMQAVTHCPSNTSTDQWASGSWRVRTTQPSTA